MNKITPEELEVKDKRIVELEKQLAEKKKEIEYKNYECKKWQRYYENCSELEKTVSRERQYCLDNWRACKKDKTDIAIEQLEKVKDFIRTNNLTMDRLRNLDFIDNQIKECKGGN